MKRAAGTARRLPPVLAVGLLVLWLLLNRSVSPGHVALGLVLALGVAWASSRLRPLQPKFRRAQLFVALLAFVLRDIVRSNFNVARVVLGLRGGTELRSGFVKVPLALKDPHGLAVLAGIVTSTPGTVWVGHDAESSVLTLHVFDLRDEAASIAAIKEPYERLLLEIFQ
jgi:multicomponent K+:H+ antiporter subunit E